MIAKKSLGQHFLRCGWVSNTLIAVAELSKKYTVLEIGPGTGILTRPLAAAVGKVIAVEKDEALAAQTAATLKQEGATNVQIITGDILKLLPDLPPYDKVIANIPYYLTGRLIRLLLESPAKPSLIGLTIQKEVAARIVARPPHMTLLALAVQAFGTPKIIKTVPASCFAPKPKIDSAIITISDISDDFFTKNSIGQNAFFTIARAAFGHKRKMLVNTLPTNGDKAHIMEKLAAIGLSPRARPEELSLQNWADITKIFTRPRSNGKLVI